MKNSLLLLALLITYFASSQTTTYYKSHILTTNFSIPVARFNFVKSSSQTNAKGEVSLFSSVGAGFGWSYGERKEIVENDITIDEDFKNIFGVHIGALFSADSGEDNKNVFAPVLNLVVLDFQLGVGYELGTTQPNLSRTFLTLSYAIPLYKLTRTGFHTISEKPNNVTTTDAAGNSTTVNKALLAK